MISERKTVPRPGPTSGPVLMYCAPLRGRRDEAAGSPGPRPARGVGIALRQERRALLAITDRGTYSVRRYGAHPARRQSSGGHRDGGREGDHHSGQHVLPEQQPEETSEQQQGQQQLLQTPDHAAHPLPLSPSTASTNYPTDTTPRPAPRFPRPPFPAITVSRDHLFNVPHTTSRYLEVYSGVQVVSVMYAPGSL